MTNANQITIGTRFHDTTPSGQVRRYRVHHVWEQDGRKMLSYFRCKRNGSTFGQHRTMPADDLNESGRFTIDSY